MDEFVRHCLLKGLDDISLTLEHEAEIAAYEAHGIRHPPAGAPINRKPPVKARKDL